MDNKKNNLITPIPDGHEQLVSQLTKLDHDTFYKIFNCSIERLERSTKKNLLKLLVSIDPKKQYDDWKKIEEQFDEILKPEEELFKNKEDIE